MVKVKPEASVKKIKSIGISMLGTTTKPIMSVIKPELEKLGYEVLTFHANGTGGDCMDTLAAEGDFAAVLDFFNQRIGGQQFWGVYSRQARKNGSRNLKLMGVPTVVTPGRGQHHRIESRRSTAAKI